MTQILQNASAAAGITMAQACFSLLSSCAAATINLVLHIPLCMTCTLKGGWRTKLQVGLCKRVTNDIHKYVLKFPTFPIFAKFTMKRKNFHWPKELKFAHGVQNMTTAFSADSLLPLRTLPVFWIIRQGYYTGDTTLSPISYIRLGHICTCVFESAGCRYISPFFWMGCCTHERCWESSPWPFYKKCAAPVHSRPTHHDAAYMLGCHKMG